ncbi:MAG: hypothetical protein ACREUR_10230 [Nitrosospira sp.]
MKLTERISNSLVLSGSPGATPSSRYIGYWPMSMWKTPGTYDLSTQAATLAVDAANNWIAGFASAGWATAGIPVKVRSSGSMPGGLSNSVIYYAGKPAADRLTLHLTKAGALAGTDIVDITSQGSANVIVYPAYIKDYSGQGNDLLYGYSLFDTMAFGAFPYMSSASSGSIDMVAGRLDYTTLLGRFVWPADTFLCFFRVRFGALIAGRSFFGNGANGITHGPRLQVAATDASRLTLQVTHAGNPITSGNSALKACSTTIEHHIALALDGPNARATVWIDGDRDFNIGALDLSTVAAMNFTTDLRLGGATASNTHAAGFRDYHAFAWRGSLPQNIDDLVARAAVSNYHRFSDSEL